MKTTSKPHSRYGLHAPKVGQAGNSKYSHKALICLIVLALFVVCMAQTGCVGLTNAKTSEATSGTTSPSSNQPVAPTVGTQPASQTIMSGQSASFSISASGTATLSYQWARNGSPIPSANSASYSTPTETISDNGAQFAVTVSNSAGSVTSNAAVLTVSAAPVAPSITGQPSSQTITSGQTASFFVSASGTPTLTYQWTKNGSAISGATAASYTTPSESSGDNGAQFAVTVSNSAGNTTSNAAALTVNQAVVAPSITSQPAPQTIVSGQTASFFVTASGTNPMNYQWFKNGSAIGGATSASFTTPAETTADSGSSFTVSVSNNGGSSTSNAAALTVNAAAVAPSITSQPAPQTVNSGQTATFAVAAAGTGPLSYQWMLNGSNISGANGSSYTTPATSSANNNSTFSVLVSNVAGNATSNSATLTVTTSNPQYTMSAKTSSLTFGGTVGGGNPAPQTERIIDTGPNNTCTPFTASVTTAWLSVNPASSCAAGDLTISVNITGLSAGTYNGALTITSAQETNSPLIVPITLTLASSGTSSLNPSLSSLNFNSVNIGANTSQGVTLTNNGSASITISNVTVQGAGFTPSGVSSGLIIPSGQTATLSVQFAPASAGAVNGNVTVTSNASNASVVITVSGTGVQTTSHSVVLNWGGSTSSISGYDVFRSTTPGQNYVQLNSSPVGGTQYTDSGVQSGNTYYYVVTAVNSNGVQSTDSNQATATIP